MTKTRINDRSGELFNYVMLKHRLKRDTDLADFLGTTKSYVSEIRNGRTEVGAAMLVRICERAGVTLKMARAKLEEKGVKNG